MRRLLIGFLGFLLLVLVGVRFAEPVGDGDLFWQMAYGRYMVDHHTLVPDHTVFSWTPSSNETIYCSWIAEIVFYALYNVGGLPMIFAFRYACVLLSLWLFFDYSRRVAARGPGLTLAGRPELYLCATLMVLGCYVGTIIKPEIFSLVCFHLLAWGYFTMKLQARGPERPGRGWLCFFPLLMLFWVNSHGVFMFGLAALLVLCVGEWLNRWLSPGLSLPQPRLRQFTWATALSVAACLVTPYGVYYPLQLLRELLGMVRGTQSAGDAVAYASLAAHQKITDVMGFHLVPIMVAMVVSLLFYGMSLARLGGKGRRLDLAVLGVNLAMGVLYFWYVRTTYYWPPFWGYSCLYLLLEIGSSGEAGLACMRPRRLSTGVVSLVTVGITAFCVWQARYLPYASSWMGFGISYWNPVEEAEWVERFAPQARIYNDYDGGGYLLWRLYPNTKVMIDPRSFPYRAWYSDYNLFEGGQIFDDFLDGFSQQADVAVISHKNEALWRSFASSGKWVVAWVGPSSAVFTRPGMKFPSGAAEYDPQRFRRYRNFERAMQAYTLCIQFGLYDAGFAVLRGMAENFGDDPEQKQLLGAFTRMKDALVAENSEGNLDKALLLYEECRREGLFYSEPKLMDLYKWKLADLQKHNVGNKNVQQIRDLAIRMAAVARGEAPPMPTKQLVGPPLQPKAVPTR